MDSLRWLLPTLINLPRINKSFPNVAVAAAALSLGFASSKERLIINVNRVKDKQFLLPFASLSFGPELQNQETIIDDKSGVEFPLVLADGTKQLAGIGLRKKSLFGLKNIVVYAYGLYADGLTLVQELGQKYSSVPIHSLSNDKKFYDDVIDGDFSLTVRLVIVYNRLKIGSVRSAFEDSVGGRIKKFSGSEDKALLSSFTSLFCDEFKLPKGTTIDITRLPGYVLQTKINGVDIGSVQSELLCRSVFDLYIGEEPFDKDGKAKIGAGLGSMLIS